MWRACDMPMTSLSKFHTRLNKNKMALAAAAMKRANVSYLASLIIKFDFRVPAWISFDELSLIIF